MIKLYEVKIYGLQIYLNVSVITNKKVNQIKKKSRFDRPNGIEGLNKSMELSNSKIRGTLGDR